MRIISTGLFLRKGTSSLLWMVVLLACGVFVVTSLASVRSPRKFDSPDETANYYFAVQFAQTTTLEVPQEIAVAVSLVHPRGVSVRDGALEPGSFIGLPLLYGAVAKVVGNGVITLLTPLFSSLALLAFFALVRRVFPSAVSFLATILLALHPAFLYYTSRGLYHNALFFDFLIIALWATLAALALPREGEGTVTPSRTVRWQSIAWYGLAGLAWGATLAVRTAEAAWVGVLLLILAVFLWRRIDIRVGIWVGVLAGVLPLAVVLGFNAALYGHPLSFGYEELITPPVGEGPAAGVAGRALLLLFPFGLKSSTAIVNFWNYGLALFWWLSLPALLGYLLMVRKVFPLWGARVRSHVTGVRRGIVHAWRGRVRGLPVLSIGGYLLVYTVVALWLVLFYGSWEFHDNPDPTKVTIGTSYVRYWLPIYAFGLPFAAQALIAFSRRVGGTFGHVEADARRWRRRFTQIGLVALLSFVIYHLSFSAVVLDREEGLAVIRAHSLEYKRLAQLVERHTPPDAVIIAGKADKVFFPERRVIVSVEGGEALQDLAKLLAVVPVYLYVSPLEEPASTERLWQARGFALRDPLPLSKRERLYRVEKLREN